MIDEIELKQPKIKYPDRVVQFMRNTPYLSQFDGDQSFINMEEQESNMAKEQVLQQAIRLMAGKNKLTHASLRARTIVDRPSYPPPSDYESVPSDFTGYADSEVERRKVEKRARNLAMAERAKQDLEEHVKQTARGLFADSEPEDLPKPPGRSIKTILSNVFGGREELASSSTSKAVYPVDLSTPEPKTKRATKRPGTKREGDEPEGVPRRTREKSQPSVEPKAKPKGKSKKQT